MPMSDLVLNSQSANDLSWQAVSHQATVSPRNLPEAPPPYSVVDGHIERLGSNASDAPPYTEISTPPIAAANGTRFSEQPAQVLPAAQALEILPNIRPSGLPGSPISGKIIHLRW